MRIAVLALLAFAAPVRANERTLTITDFDGVRVEGPFVVTVVTGRGSGGRLSGSTRALDHVRVVVEDGMAVIRAAEDADDATPARVMLTTRMLTRASIAGPGSLSVDRASGSEFRATLEGAGNLSIGGLTTDHLTAIAQGSGTMTLAGKAADATLEARGSGVLDATRLTIADAKISVEGSAVLTAAASRSAVLSIKGAGSATVYGKAACTVKREGSGVALCGKAAGAVALAAAIPAPARATLPQVRVGIPPGLRLVRRAGRP